MDHMMPGMDGIEAVRIIREKIGTDYARNVPIIALTANAIIGNEEMFLEHGFQAFISKPIDAQRLDSVLRQWVRNKNIEKELSAGSELEPAVTETFTLPFDDVDTVAGLERFSGNEEIYKSVLKSYVTNTRSLLDSLSGHLEEENLTDYAILVHGIKGSSFTIGAMDLGAKAEHMEHLAKAGEKERVLAENSAFVESVKNLLDLIDSALSVYKSQTSKPVATAPDPALLRELREACAEYDVGRIDRIMAQLDSFEYEKGTELVTWLQGQVDDMNFRVIIEGDWPA
jgi:HPt (histidine-containing phosphotransfer) domain-containing protein